MDNTKNDKYFIDKILTDLHFIVEHLEGISKEELEK